MNFQDYVKERTRIFNIQDANKDCLNLLWGSNALAGEAGEFANLVKKIYRDEGGSVNFEFHEKLISELGDLLWYWVFVCDVLQINPKEVMVYNMNKLKVRYGIE